MNYGRISNDNRTKEEALQYKEVGRFLLANSQRKVKVNDNTTFLIKNKGC